jgi:hypothetical protein
MKDYFKLLLVMTNRKIKELGVSPALGYLLSLVAYILLAELIFQNTEFAQYLFSLICLGLLFHLSEKNRIDFLRSTFGDTTQMKIRMIENAILCFPFVIILLIKSYFLEAGLLLIVSIILALFSFPSKFNFTLPTPFSKHPFEFSTGFRKTFFMFPLVYILTAIAIKVDNLNLGIFAFLLVFLTTFSYYFKPEPEYYVWIYAETPKTFLKNKLFIASKNVLLLTAPILIGLLVYFPSVFPLIFILFFIGLVFLWILIFAKYSALPREVNLPERILIGFSLYIPPLLLVLLPYFYKKSLSNLKDILDDKN